MEKIDIRQLYPEFASLDDNSFFRIFIGYLIFALPKFLINLFFALMQIIQLRQNMKNLKEPVTNPEEWSILSNTINIATDCIFSPNSRMS